MDACGFCTACSGIAYTKFWDWTEVVQEACIIFKHHCSAPVVLNETKNLTLQPVILLMYSMEQYLRQLEKILLFCLYKKQDDTETFRLRALPFAQDDMIDSITLATWAKIRINAQPDIIYAVVAESVDAQR